MQFEKRKEAAMAAMHSPAPDKSPKGNVDAPIIPLLSVINRHPSYFTTSSCSGRISILSQDKTSPSAVKKKSGGGSWLFVSHDSVQPQAISTLLFPLSSQAVDSNDQPRFGGSLFFRFEPLIIAVECKNLEAAQSLVSLAISCGFRESGITSVKKRVIIAIRCSIRLEVPLGTRNKLMVFPEYVEYLVEVANEKMDTNRKRTDLFLNKLVCAFNFQEKSGFDGADLNCNSSDTIIEEKNRFQCDSVGYEVQVPETQVSSDSKQHPNHNGGLAENVVHLSNLELVGEPIERLFLWGHSTCTLYGKKIIVFGGFGGIGRHGRRNELLVLDPDSQSVEIIDVPGAPSPRLGHTCSFVGDSIYVIGGRAGPLNILNEVWVFNFVKQDWMLLQCSGCLFPPRHRHTAVVVGLKIYVYGGFNNDTVSSTLYVLDTISFNWSEIVTKGDQPGPCHSHSMIADGSNLYLFGGYDGDKALSDLYCFDIKKSRWSKLKTYGRSPYARFSHSMLIYLNHLFIFGGCPLGEYQELFILDLQNLSWKSLMIKSSGNLFVRSTVNVIGDDFIIIGGGASCYAFGTKFSEPMRYNLIQTMLLCDDKVHTPVEEKCLKSQDDVDCLFGGAGLPCVLRLKKKYAKLGKDILKRFGWLDLGRRVYSKEGGSYICFPVTAEFCGLFQDNNKCGDRNEEVISVLTSSSPNAMKDISSSVAIDFLAVFGATKLIDEFVKVKKKSSSPYKVMSEAIATLLSDHGLPLKLLEQLPSRWEKLGDIIVLPVGSFTDPLWDIIQEELWLLVAQSLGTHRLARQGQIAQTGTRDSNLEILIGKDGWVEHRENGILYCFDPTKCMFSWGNASEKLRMAQLDCRGEVIVDLFAGIGYFVLPFLVRANAKMVYACEWNPHAIEALRCNLRTNNVADRCVVLEGDNRDTVPRNVADRVCLGLLPSSECSWVTAVRALRDEGGRLHIHGNVKDCEEGSWVDHVSTSISDLARAEGRVWDIWVEHVEKVKWYAPHVRHVVVDVRCRLKKKIGPSPFVAVVPLSNHLI